jgi:hypothetical protein
MRYQLTFVEQGQPEVVRVTEVWQRARVPVKPRAIVTRDFSPA